MCFCVEILEAIEENHLSGCEEEEIPKLSTLSVALVFSVGGRYGVASERKTF